jgi:CubicO group peptidase (beta-lactamase class C family)
VTTRPLLLQRDDGVTRTARRAGMKQLANATAVRTIAAAPNDTGSLRDTAWMKAPPKRFAMIWRRTKRHPSAQPMTSTIKRRATYGGVVLLFASALLCRAQAVQATGGYSKAVAAAHNIVLSAYQRGLPAPTDAPFHGERVRPPALSVAIAEHGRIVYAEAFGLADLEQRVPANTNTATKFRVGSISKPFTAAALGLLYQHGKLGLDAPIRRYVPSFPDKGVSITVRQVGGHLGGIRGYKPNEPEGQTHYPSVDSSRSRFEDDSLIAHPGTKFVYSSYGFVLLSAVIEHAAGIPYLDFMRDSVFRMLGMTNTVPDDTSASFPVARGGTIFKQTEHLSQFRIRRFELQVGRRGISVHTDGPRPFRNGDAPFRFLGPHDAARLGDVASHNIGQGDPVWNRMVCFRFDAFIKQRTIRHSGGAVGSTAIYADYDIVVAWAQNDGQLNRQ